MITKIKSISSIVWADICDTYSRIKIYLLGILAIIAVIEWRKIKAALLVYGAQKEMNSDKKEDQVLANQESNANNQANALVQQANQLPSQEQPIGEDWYKKDQK